MQWKLGLVAHFATLGACSKKKQEISGQPFPLSNILELGLGLLQMDDLQWKRRGSIPGQKSIRQSRCGSRILFRGGFKLEVIYKQQGSWLRLAFLFLGRPCLSLSLSLFSKNNCSTLTLRGDLVSLFGVFCWKLQNGEKQDEASTMGPPPCVRLCCKWRDTIDSFSTKRNLQVYNLKPNVTQINQPMTDGGVANSALLTGFHNWVTLGLSLRCN